MWMIWICRSETQQRIGVEEAVLRVEEMGQGEQAMPPFIVLTRPMKKKLVGSQKCWDGFPFRFSAIPFLLPAALLPTLFPAVYWAIAAVPLVGVEVAVGVAVGLCQPIT